MIIERISDGVRFAIKKPVLEYNLNKNVWRFICFIE